MKLKELSSITSTLNILYVEDDTTLREQNSAFFSQLFKSVKVATDGEEALELYKEKNFDIIITDINIPKINGLSMIKLMKKKNKEQKFLITTVYKKEELKEQLNCLNLDYFLTKPILTKALVEQIEEIVSELEISV